jgi:maleylpyruvate isomerase
VNARHDIGLTRRWMRDGERFVAGTVHRIADADLCAPSLLPGWSRAHVVGHLARNAEALGRLAAWAHTGVETPMYRDRDQRAAEIEAASALPAEVLRRDLDRTAEDLERALDALNDQSWHAEVRSALGRTVPAAEIPWMRVREVWLHAVDLDAGACLADLPTEVIDALLDDVTASLSARDGCPAVLLEPTDRDRCWRLGPGEGKVARSTATELLGWLTGRDRDVQVTTPHGGLPAVPRWL